ncbi:MAG: hypothetical protein SFV81_02615, partial [Pirellulaceae bacterium]|nr:hypothetical protein [Pirellulaceae bacterium]
MTDDQDGHALQEGDPNELRKHIQGLFGNQLKSLAIETTEHGLILHGACDSFYTKQLVQEVVRKHSRQRIVLNALVVDEPKTKPASEDHFERGFIASQPTLLPDYEHGQEPHRREENALHHKANTMHELSRNTEQEPSLPESAQDQDSQLKVDVTPRSFTTIFHPSDFSEPSKVAFAHALKLALDAKAMLQMMH